MTLTLHKKLDYLVCPSDQKDIKYITGNICLELSETRIHCQNLESSIQRCTSLCNKKDLRECKSSQLLDPLQRLPELTFFCCLLLFPFVTSLEYDLQSLKIPCKYSNLCYICNYTGKLKTNKTPKCNRQHQRICIL